ncbi:restriction endonuclease [Streptomyces aurantiacus]|uniref:restriction endonuclease n=1 Tax=Streptomyces aurantiacus TaxID=47760 RepID=UPI000D13A535|nr:restriction endonuclease [Streptomyces aurantiacus]
MAQRGSGRGNEYQRQQQALRRAQDQQARQVERERKAAETASKRQERERKAAYQEQQAEQAQVRTIGVEHEVEQLGQLLRDALVGDPPTTFEGRRRTHKPRGWDERPWSRPEPSPRWEEFAPSEPGGLAAVLGLGRKRYEAEVAEARVRFGDAQERHRRAEDERLATLERKQTEYRQAEERALAEIGAFNRQLDEERESYRAGEPAAVEAHLGAVLDASRYPLGFPHEHRIAFRPATGDVLVEVHLPPEGIVPAARGYRYVKSRDETTVLPRPEKERKEIYASVLAQVALRTVHEILMGDPDRIINGVILNGHVKTIDRATGQEVSPCLVTLSTSREQFGKLRLSQVDPVHCLKGLNALVSPNPYDLEPIRPIIEFDLSKYRLMDSMDVVADLDSRPVLVKLTPSEFEHLIRQLFEAIGMEAWNTQASKDEGVDAIAISKDPVFNGECIIQAKRYTRLVGVESVQALAGVVEHKRAAKGVLITTSWFGRASHDFARQHGRLQLIEGPELKYLIKEHLGKDVIPGPVPPKRRPSR